MSNNIFPVITISLQVLVAVLGLNYLRKVRSTFLLGLVVILCLTAFVELAGLYYLKVKRPNYYLYITYIFCIFNLISLIFWSIIKLKLKLILIMFPVIFNLSFFFFSLEKSFFTFMTIGSVNTSIYSFLYLRQLLVSDEIINYRKLLPFWVSVGFLVFYLPSIPFFSLVNNMRTRELFFITKVLAVFMNIFIIYGFICSNKEETY